MMGRQEEDMWMIERATLVFKAKYRHEEDPCIIERVTLLFKIIYMQSELNYKKVLIKARVIFMN